jgi:hypothetical protein
VELKSVEDLGNSRYRLTIDEIVFDVVYTVNGVIEGISGPSEFFNKLNSEDLAETKAMNSAIFGRIQELRK